jgi:hypothetical protein
MNSSSSDLFAGGAALACYGLFLILALVLMVVIYWKLFSKAGYSGWLSLLMFIPLVNLGMFLFLAFADWPVLREVRDLRSRLAASAYGAGGGYGSPGGYAAPTAPAYQPPAQPVPPAYQAPAPPVYQPPAEQPAPPTYPPAPPYPPA